jgi:nucleoid-associated protein YgaU
VVQVFNATNADAQGRYRAALRVIEKQGVRLEHLHVQDNKLFLQGVAPSEAAKNKVWDEIKRVNPNYDDINADIAVAQTQAAAASAGGGQSSHTYTVQPGDNLSKISKQFYGDANKYTQIFEASKDNLSDPNNVKAGQVLTIPNR